MQPLSENPLPLVAIFRAPLFNASETFVRLHALSLARYRPLLVGLEDKGNVPAELRDAMFLPNGTGEAALARIGKWGSVVERLREQGPTLVHAHFGPDALAAVPLAEALGVPLVATLHGYDITRARTRLLLSGRLSWTRYALLRRRLIERCSLFLPVSDALREVALAQGFPAERTRTHYLGVDVERFSPGDESEPGLVLHVGRLVEKKGTAVLIDAMRKLPDARLVVIGDGPERRRLERQAGGLGERVRFLGQLTSPEVVDWMRRADVLAAPSITARDGDAEGLPTVLVEAGACGLPVVATHHSGIPEVIAHEYSGLLVPERDAEALATNISFLLKSRKIRGQMAIHARRLVQERFNARTQTAKLEAIYDEVRGQIRP